MYNKVRLRKKFFLLRQKRYKEINPSFFLPLVKLIKRFFQKKNVNLSCYYPSSFEVNVLKIFELKNFKKIKVHLPVISKNKSMNFYLWNNKDTLKINKYGMLEPFKSSNSTIPNIILVPLLAYDNQKNRLGYGGGFYDRYLKKYLKNNKNILTIGIAFSFQKYHKLPVDKNDVRLNYILTEKGIF